MTMTLSDLRKRRDVHEAEELARRNDEIREKLVPFLMMDCRSELTADDGLTLVELCDDFEIDDQQYDSMKSAVKPICRNCEVVAELQPQLVDEHIRFCQLTIQKRRSEVMAQQAALADGLQRDMRAIVAATRQSLAEAAETHPYLFAGGSPLREVLDLQLPVRPKKIAEPTRQCPICLSDFSGGDDDFCTPRCRHIAGRHAPALTELGILKKPQTRKTENGND